MTSSWACAALQSARVLWLRQRTSEPNGSVTSSWTLRRVVETLRYHFYAASRRRLNTRPSNTPTHPSSTPSAKSTSTPLPLSVGVRAAFNFFFHDLLKLCDLRNSNSKFDESRDFNGFWETCVCVYMYIKDCTVGDYYESVLCTFFWRVGEAFLIGLLTRSMVLSHIYDFISID